MNITHTKSLHTNASILEKLNGSIYIHIPFCKYACIYCDFHFSTSMKKKEEMVLALNNEIIHRKKEFELTVVESIYFGGGTPSRLQISELKLLLDTVFIHYLIADNLEITIEANPDDLTEQYIRDLKKIGINRLSIGVQSFFDDDLKMMNRSHTAENSKECLQIATRYFDNISLDLIYGIPNMSNKKWQENIETTLAFNIPHISCYALTVEPKTVLKKLINKKIINNPKDEVTEAHFRILSDMLEKQGFINYELSNFGKENYFSVNNSNYWLGKKYIGIGPSAHSFNGISRSWNVSNNSIYIKSIKDNILPNETEILSIKDKYNEYVMTGLRTIWGVSLDKIEIDFGKIYLKYCLNQAQKFVYNHLIFIDNNILKTTKKGKFLTDGIASELFFV